MKNIFVIAFSLFLCACAYSTKDSSSESKTAAADSSAGSAETSAKISSADGPYSKKNEKQEESYCSKIRRFKVSRIGDDFVIAGECSNLLPDKVCLMPKTQYVYFKKNQLIKIGVKVIYDGLIFALPEKKCVRFTNSYTYKTKIDNVSELIFGEKSDTTIPVAEIAGRY